jgi:hypothetical protein
MDREYVRGLIDTLLLGLCGVTIVAIAAFVLVAVR